MISGAIGDCPVWWAGCGGHGAVCTSNGAVPAVAHGQRVGLRTAPGAGADRHGRRSNEIIAVPKLLEMLSLRGTIVANDAFNCQRAIARQITDQCGDYALALKGNQSAQHDDVKLFLDDPSCAELGRIGVRPNKATDVSR
jgi:hypothetical protein